MSESMGPYYVRGVRPDGEVYWTAYTRMRRFPDGDLPSCEAVLFRPKPAGHPGLMRSCAGCYQQLRIGDLTTLIPVGPGDSAEEREKAASGYWFSGVALEAHWACATGEAVTSEPPARSEEKT